MLEDCSEIREEKYDLVVLSSAMEPATGIEILNDKLKLERSPDGFFKEFHSRLNPIDTSTVGISLAGAAQGPKSIAETIMQAKGAASSANIIMRPGEYTMRMEKAIVDIPRCSKCGLCVEVCPYGAISLDPKEKFAVVDEVKCRACGMCAATCPSQAITVRNSRGTQFNAVIDNLLYRAME
jgi:heterodisulfide reductase subunit A